MAELVGRAVQQDETSVGPQEVGRVRVAAAKGLKQGAHSKLVCVGGRGVRMAEQEGVVESKDDEGYWITGTQALHPCGIPHALNSSRRTYVTYEVGLSLRGIRIDPSFQRSRAW